MNRSQQIHHRNSNGTTVRFSSRAYADVWEILRTLNRSNFDQVFRGVWQLVDYGCDGGILLLQACFGYIRFHQGELTEVQNMQLMFDLLAAVLRNLMEKPNFSTVLCVAVGTMNIIEQKLGHLCVNLHLSLSEKVGVGLALTESENLIIRTSAKKFCMTQIEELSNGSSVVDSPELLRDIIMYLSQSKGLCKHVDCFMRMISLMEPTENIPLTLAQLLSDDFCEARCSRNLNMLSGCIEYEFDAILEEMENEMSMAGIMKELGYGCTIDIPRCKEILSLSMPLTEATVARLLGITASTHVSLGSNHNFYSVFCSTCVGSWNINVLLDSIKQLAPEINWTLVMKNLDHEGFYIQNAEAFSFLMSVYAHACQDPFPLDAICGIIWKNVDGQISFIKYAVSAPPEIFTFAHSARRLVNDIELHAHQGPHGEANDAWLSLELMEVLCHLAERGHAGSIRAILEDPLKVCPEILLLAIAQIDTTYNLLQSGVSSAILSKLVDDGMQSGVVFLLWHSNPKLVIQGVIDMSKEHEKSAFLILNIFHELKILSDLLEQIPFPCSIQLALLAHAKGYINLEKWLNDNIRTYKDVFYEACTKFLRDGPEDISTKAWQTGVNLFSELHSTFQKVIEANTELILPNNLSKELNIFHKTDMKGALEIPSVDSSILLSSDGTNIEAEANSYFEQLFNGQLNTDEMVKMLACYKESSERREQLIFGHMIKTILEERQFFSKYPDIQLNIVAALVGSLIKHRLLDLTTLGTFLRAVLDALRKPSKSKMFAFGMIALGQFLERLVEWPVYCNHILQISHLHGQHPELVALIEHTLVRVSSGCFRSDESSNTSVSQQGGYSLSFSDNIEREKGSLGDRHTASSTSNTVTYFKQELPSSVIPSNVSLIEVPASRKSSLPRSLQAASTTPASKLSSGFLHSSKRITSTSVLRQNLNTTGFGAALNTGTLVAAAETMGIPIEAPPSDIQDKILFMINNISISNFEAKAKAFHEILSEQYYPWFAQYMVMRRASTEPNFHDMYLKFLVKIDSKSLNQEILKASYHNCKVLLRSILIKSSSEERSLLKNLGSWLGKFTIGRNQGLRAREIDPKSLIIQAYEKGLMIAVIPFISKILESCQSSLAFRPPNPWTMAILGLYVEIYTLPNLKMSMQFEIEVLFKTICVDMKKVKPTSLLKGLFREVEGNRNFAIKTQPQMVAENNSGNLSTSSQYSAPLHLVSTPLIEDENLVTLSQSDQLPSWQGLSQVAPGQLPSCVNQALETIDHELAIQLSSRRKHVQAVGSSSFHTSMYSMGLQPESCRYKPGNLSYPQQRVYESLNKLPAGLPTSSTVSLHPSLSRAYVPPAGQFYSSRSSVAAQPVDPVPIETESSSSQFLRVSSSSVGENLNWNGSKLNKGADSSAASNSEPHFAETSYVAKELGSPPVSLPTSSTDRLETGAPESLLPTGGALEKYQIVALKGFDFSTTSMEDSTNIEVGRADDSSFRQKVSEVFEEWYQTYELHHANEAACNRFILQLQQSGYLKGDGLSDQFFFLLTELCVARCVSTKGVTSSSYSLQSHQASQNLSFLAIDIYAKLVHLILKYCMVEHGQTTLLPKILSVTVRAIQKDAKEKRASFNPRPYYRLFINWMFDLLAPDPILDSAVSQVLVAFANSFHLLQPLNVPGFSFAWLELVSHTSFMPKLLLENPQNGWPQFQQLLVDLFKFMEPYLRNSELDEPIQFLYKSSLRLLLVMLHDVPDFLSAYHFSFCDVIPTSCIQMRNVILSAFPCSIRLPGPSPANLKIDLAEISQSPHTCSEIEAALKSKQMKSDVDEFLKTRHQGLFFSELRQKLLLTQFEAPKAGTRYNIPLINSLVLYIGIQTIHQLQTKAQPSRAQQMAYNVSMECLTGAAIDIFQMLIRDFDKEGRYLFLNAIANQLRFPNNITQFFSYVLLRLFLEANQDIVQEQIARVLVERLFGQIPHPWGLVVTFIELIKNPKYDFWNRPFARSSPEIEKLLKSVASAFLGPKHLDDCIVSGGNS